ncbi:hypothetical protein [Amycolatopsis sp. NPDC102389]|uniref:hypothetical protein n=1 Tax=Amycolatopsis sp. NPDC102389 TaxID=3363941 RepID=UPI003813E94F
MDAEPEMTIGKSLWARSRRRARTCDPVGLIVAEDVLGDIVPNDLSSSGMGKLADVHTCTASAPLQNPDELFNALDVATALGVGGLARTGGALLYAEEDAAMAMQERLPYDERNALSDNSCA